MYVADRNVLADLCDSIAGAPLLAVDTEFMRERTYFARLCLIQIATEETTAIIDPLAIGDIEPLFAVLRDERTVKVLHAGQQDLEIFWLLMGQTVRPVFDTQIAATLAGFQQQVGYGALVKELLGLELDKSDTYTDWAGRPLSDTQIEYALNDVRYLPEVYRNLSDRLEAAGRISWLAADFDRLADPATYKVDPEEVFRRIKRLSSLNRRQLGVLQKIAAWREREAQRKDVPRRWVIGDESLVEIARRSPSSAGALSAVRGVADKLAKSAYPGLLAAVAEGGALDDDELPRLDKRRRRPVDIDGVVDLMAALVRVRARQHGVAVPLLASRDDIEAVASGQRESTALLEGWRRTLVGDEVLDLLDGRIALSVEDGLLTVRRTCEDLIGDIEDGTHLA